MTAKPTAKQLLRAGLAVLICLGVDLALAWLGEMLLTIGSIIIGIVVGLTVWLLSDFQTGFYCGFFAWILGWFLLFFMRVIWEFALDLFFQPKRDSPKTKGLGTSCRR